MRGGARQGAGRKPKDEEQSLIKRLSPYDSIAFEKLIEGVKEGQYRYLKLYFEYRYGRPIPMLPPEEEKSEPITINVVVDSEERAERIKGNQPEKK